MHSISFTHYVILLLNQTHRNSFSKLDIFKRPLKTLIHFSVSGNFNDVESPFKTKIWINITTTLGQFVMLNCSGRNKVLVKIIIQFYSCICIPCYIWITAISVPVLVDLPGCYWNRVDNFIFSNHGCLVGCQLLTSYLIYFSVLLNWVKVIHYKHDSVARYEKVRCKYLVCHSL